MSLQERQQQCSLYQVPGSTKANNQHFLIAKLHLHPNKMQQEQHCLRKHMKETTSSMGLLGAVDMRENLQKHKETQSSATTKRMKTMKLTHAYYECQKTLLDFPNPCAETVTERNVKLE